GDRRGAHRGGHAPGCRDGARRGRDPRRLGGLNRTSRPTNDPAGGARVVHNSSMARWRAPLLSGRSVGGRVLTDADVPDALRVCAQVPVVSVLAATRVATAAEVGLRRAGGVLWGFERDGELIAVCWSGANLVPVVPPGAEEAIGAFARLARSAARRSSSIVGERSAVRGLWEQLESHWPTPREIRAEQPSLVIDSEPLAVPD